MYPNSNTLLVTTNALKSFGVFDTNINEHTVLPIIKYVQDEVVHNVIGTQLYEKLLDLINTDTVNVVNNECYKELLDGYLFYIMAWKVKAHLQLDIHEKTRNAGSVRVSDDRVYPNSYQDVQKIADQYHERGNKYLIELGKYLRCQCANGCFPELRYFDNCWWEKSPNESNPTHQHIYFPSKQRRCGLYGRDRRW